MENLIENGTYQFNGYLSGRMRYGTNIRFTPADFSKNVSLGLFILANFCYMPFQPFIC